MQHCPCVAFAIAHSEAQPWFGVARRYEIYELQPTCVIKSRLRNTCCIALHQKCIISIIPDLIRDGDGFRCHIWALLLDIYVDLLFLVWQNHLAWILVWIVASPCALDPLLHTSTCPRCDYGCVHHDERAATWCTQASWCVCDLLRAYIM